MIAILNEGETIDDVVDTLKAHLEAAIEEELPHAIIRERLRLVVDALTKQARLYNEVQ